MTYAEKLRDPRWQKKRLQTLERAEWTCEACGDEEVTLHVHHKEYFKGRDPWEYDDNQLAVVCSNCHENIHSEPDILKDVISRLNLDGPRSRDEIAYLIAGYCGFELKPQHKRHEAVLEAGDLAHDFANELSRRFVMGKAA